ncbi:nucleotide-binding domain-containing protein [Mycena olivaceomarginata]|nr:nucleotide-binding domain-containing protein [Mycena olivaceomarginata]
MGALFSRLRLIYHTLKSISDSFSVLSERISRDPGLPGPNPSRSYWSEPPSPLDARPKKPLLPEYADVVIIGRDYRSEEPLRVVMLEARDVCSGATGRNGGHISPNTYQDYSEVAAKYGPSAAQAIMRFRLAHLPALLEVATEEGLLRESQARRVDQFDAYLQDKVYQRAKNELEGYLTACPERRGKHIVSDDDKSALKLKDLQLSSRVAGYISQPGGALHSYRLITGILSRLLAAYPSFRLFTNTPCTDIGLTVDRGSYRIATSQGILSATHVVHATNAWASHLLPGMRRKIVPATAGSPSWAGTRAFVFYPGTSMLAFDYLTQHPPTPAETRRIPLMFGGGAMLGGRAEAALMDNVGVTDDSQTDFEVTAYLGGALERYFQPGWGEEGAVSETATTQGNREWGAGRVKTAWSGIMGMSADGQPWVGRVPLCASRRGAQETVSAASRRDEHSLAPSGEWIAAGFAGEGMTHAWLAGVALARMVLDKPTENPSNASALPPQFVITEKRWKEADIEGFLADVGAE